MKNILNYNDREAILQRLQKLTEKHQGRWGKLTIHELIPHLADPFRVAMGEKPGVVQKTILYNTLLGKAMRNFMPWPKGAPTDPSFLPGTGGTAYKTFEEDMNSLMLVIHRFVSFDQPIKESPVFGKMDKHAWGRLMWRHLDHHLKQFGE